MFYLCIRSTSWSISCNENIGYQFIILSLTNFQFCGHCKLAHDYKYSRGLTCNAHRIESYLMTILSFSIFLFSIKSENMTKKNLHLFICKQYYSKIDQRYIKSPFKHAATPYTYQYFVILQLKSAKRKSCIIFYQPLIPHSAPPPRIKGFFFFFFFAVFKSFFF